MWRSPLPDRPVGVAFERSHPPHAEAVRLADAIDPTPPDDAVLTAPLV